MDINHPDLKGGDLEQPGRGRRQSPGRYDGNGFIDDIHGWNFIGSREGKQLVTSTM
jgi:hypothetical protein